MALLHSLFVTLTGLQVLQSVQATSQFHLSLFQGQKPCSSLRASLQLSLLQDLRGQGLCSLQVFHWSLYDLPVEHRFTLHDLDGRIAVLAVSASPYVIQITLCGSVQHDNMSLQ